MGAGRRRTATVRTQSFATLFVLSKADLDKTLEDYPQTQAKLQTKAKALLQQDEERRERGREEGKEGGRGGEGGGREASKDEAGNGGSKASQGKRGGEFERERIALVPPSEALSSSGVCLA